MTTATTPLPTVLLPERPARELPPEAARLQAVLRGLGIRPYDPEAVRSYKRGMSRRANFAQLVWPSLALVAIVTASALLDRQFYVLAFVPALLLLFRLTEGRWRWVPRDARIDERLMPFRARERLGLIRREMPDVTYTVERFQQGDRVRDPFLVVEAGGVRYYVDVWGEREFATNSS